MLYEWLIDFSLPILSLWIWEASQIYNSQVSRKKSSCQRLRSDSKGFSASLKFPNVIGKWYPDAPCREHLPTFPLECGHFSPNMEHLGYITTAGFWKKNPVHLLSNHWKTLRYSSSILQGLYQGTPWVHQPGPRMLACSSPQGWHHMFRLGNPNLNLDLSRASIPRKNGGQIQGTTSYVLYPHFGFYWNPSS